MTDYTYNIFKHLLFNNSDSGSIFITPSMSQLAFPKGNNTIIQLPENDEYFAELNSNLTPDVKRLFIIPMFGNAASAELRERYAYRNFEKIIAKESKI